MIKKITLVLSLVAIGTTKPFSLDNILNSLLPNEIFKQLEIQKETFLSLQNNVDDVNVNVTTHYNWRHDEWHTSYNYQFDTPAAKTAFWDYQTAEQALNSQLMITTLGDGVILGALVSCLNKALKGDRFNKKMIIATVAAAIGMVLYQNKKLGKAPYFDAELKKWDNQFENVSFYTIGRILSTLAAASASYLGTDYALSRAAQVYNDIKSSN